MNRAENRASTMIAAYGAGYDWGFSGQPQHPTPEFIKENIEYSEYARGWEAGSVDKAAGAGRGQGFHPPTEDDLANEIAAQREFERAMGARADRW